MSKSNFTQETCTGTGDTMELTGATTGKIQFSKSFADGDEVDYSIEDSGGTIKVSGTGIYVAATDSITRDDDWSWNGTVVDTNPSSNITLSGGTHTITCSPSHRSFGVRKIVRDNASLKTIKPLGADGGEGASPQTITPTSIYHVPLIIPAGVTVSALNFYVTTGVASSLTRVGLVMMSKKGQVLKTLVESASVDTSTTGWKGAAVTPTYFAEETYVYAWLSSDSAIAVRAKSRNEMAYSPYWVEADADNQRNRGSVVMPVASGQPAYPAITTLSATTSGNLLDLAATVS